jgi:hypothetical protein
LGFGFWVLGFGSWVLLGLGFWVLGFGFWVLGVDIIREVLEIWGSGLRLFTCDGRAPDEGARTRRVLLSDFAAQGLNPETLDPNPKSKS